MSKNQIPTESIDKSTWGVGPWLQEQDRLEWEHAGLPCLMVRQSRLGHWCGYVAVPPSHPCHGKSSDEGPDVDVHGGLTYASACNDPVCHVPKPGDPDNVWWLGFDCAHAGDFSPASGNRFVGRGYPWPDTPYDHATATASEDWHIEKYRDVAYVQRETNQLAEQLVAIASAV